MDIQLLSGELGREVEVRVFAVDGSAQGIILNFGALHDLSTAKK